MTRFDEHQSSKLTFAESAAPSTPASGLVLVYAKTDGKLYIKDDAGTETDLTDTGSAFSGAKVYNNGTQTITNDTLTAVTFDTEDYDTDTFHSTVSNTSRLTVPSTQKYHVWTFVYFLANATGIRIVRFRIDGTTEIAPDMRNVSPSGSQPVTIFAATDVAITSASYIEVMVYQNSGGNLNIGDAATRRVQTEFGIRALG